jgi:hypothetical protein
MAGSPSSLPKESLGFNHARRLRNFKSGLRCGCGLRRWQRLLRAGCRSKQQRRYKRYNLRDAGPCSTEYVLPRAKGAVPGHAAKKRTSKFRINHWIRHTHPESASGVPLSKNLQMGTNAESIG